MDEEICDGVKVLCERMENNPEDFIEGPINPNTFDRNLGKFYYDGRNVEELAKGNPNAQETFWHLNQAEKDALVKSYKNMMRNEFTRRVVERLLEQPEPERIRFKGKGPLTMAQIASETRNGLNESFDKTYEKNHYTDSFVYKETGRYAWFSAQEIPNPWDKK